jgi:hypothetical protein
MNIPEKAILCFISFLLFSCAASQNGVTTNAGQDILGPLPKGWSSYKKSGINESSLPFTIIPEERLSPEEFTTAITFYASREQIG